jgi:hypothetical protein
MRKLAYAALILFLFTLIAGIVILTVAGLGAFRGIQSVARPVGDLVRDLSLDATPVILPNPAIIIEEINTLARLETASYTFQDVLQIEQNADILWGAFGESLLFVAFGEVTAGVDLSLMELGDLQVVDPDTLVVHLPEPQVLHASLDDQRSYVANRESGFLASENPDLETLVRRQAEARMLEAAVANGILERADRDAQQFLTRFLGQLGFTEVIFSEERPAPVTPIVPEIPKGFEVSPVPTVVLPPVTPAAP